MAIIYNQIGALRELLDVLKNEGITDFNTLDDIRKFRDNFNNLLTEIRAKNEELLSKDITQLNLKLNDQAKELEKELQIRGESLLKERKGIPLKIANLENKISTPVSWIRKKILLNREKTLETNFAEVLKEPFSHRLSQLESEEEELEDKKTNSQKWVESMSESEIERAQFILSKLIEKKLLFYGAEGEEKALNELKKLPDTYVVINDYRKQFDRAIYSRKDNTYIASIQIDHLVIGPTGVHIIETKNWSKKSVESRDLFSPVQQLLRASLAMFILFNEAISHDRLEQFSGNWGDRKISSRNYILLMDHKPSETYQFVNIVTIPEINKRITYGDEIYSKEEIKALTEYLVN